MSSFRLDVTNALLDAIREEAPKGTTVVWVARVDRSRQGKRVTVENISAEYEPRTVTGGEAADQDRTGNISVVLDVVYADAGAKKKEKAIEQLDLLVAAIDRVCQTTPWKGTLNGTADKDDAWIENTWLEKVGEMRIENLDKGWVSATMVTVQITTYEIGAP